MSAEKTPYPPQDMPPAYPGAAPGMQPNPGMAPPPGSYQQPPPGHPGQQVPYPPGPVPPGQQVHYPPGPGQPGMVQHPPPGAYGSPQAAGYVTGQPVSTNTVVVVQQHMFRQSPVNCVCPHCHQNVITSTTAEAGGLTWLLCAGICLFGFWLGCCLIPFCIDDCQDIRHSCPNCKNTIHQFRRL